VHDVPVLTDWNVDMLTAELEQQPPAFYLLTNSRSMPPGEAAALNAAAGRDLREAARRSGRALEVVSRSDSTLRGHFPGEVAALAQALGDVDAWILLPFFQEGGRYTIGDIHYVAQNDILVPAGQTEFARDPAFGYQASNLREWIVEKSGGAIAAAQVASITLDDIRTGGPDKVAARLLGLPHGAVCVVNAADRRDIEVFVAGLLAAEAQGKRYLHRTAASFVPVRAGIAPRPLLRAAELELSPGGGLVIAGSFVPTTTRQLAVLRERAGLAMVELDVAALLDDTRRADTIAVAAERAERSIGAGRTVLVATSRDLISGATAADSLLIGRRVSDALCALLAAINTRPRFLVAKGGITSSDLATRGLGVRRAIVRGQILPGVPVWQLGEESTWPGLAYVVFPGNVGGPAALADVVAALDAEV
jgi:uncharacterized protein YgbK (DUF1537 family)